MVPHVSCCDLDGFQITTLDTRTAACVQSIQSSALMIDYNKKGDKLASVAFASKPKIWDSEYGTCFRELDQKHTQTVSWSRDGSCIACGGNIRTGGTSMRGAVKIWDLRSQETVRAFVNPTIYKFLTYREKAFDSNLYSENRIFSLDWNSDSFTLVTGSADGAVALWDIRASKLLTHARLGLRERPEDVQFHPIDQKTLKVSLSLINTDELGMIPGELGHTNEWGFYEEGSDSKPKGFRTTLKEYPGNVMAWAFDGKLLASVPEHPLSGGSGEKTICLWNPEKGLQIIESQTPLSTIDWHPSELSFIAGSGDGTVFLYKAQESEDAQEKEDVEQNQKEPIANIIRNAPEPAGEYNIKNHEEKCVIS